MRRPFFAFLLLILCSSTVYAGPPSPYPDQAGEFWQFQIMGNRYLMRLTIWPDQPWRDCFEWIEGTKLAKSAKLYRLRSRPRILDIAVISGKVLFCDITSERASVTIFAPMVSPLQFEPVEPVTLRPIMDL